MFIPPNMQRCGDPPFHLSNVQYSAGTPHPAIGNGPGWGGGTGLSRRFPDSAGAEEVPRRQTTRRGSMSGLFKRVMREWVKGRSGPTILTRWRAVRTEGIAPLLRVPTRRNQDEGRRGSGTFFVIRSFPAWRAGDVDQRIIGSWLVAAAEQQRRRYRHLLPNKIKRSVVSVFG